MTRKLHTYPYYKILHWKVTFYQNMLVQNFLGAFLTIPSCPSANDALMESVCNYCYLYFMSIKYKQNRSENRRSKKYINKNDKQSTLPIRKVRPERIEACTKKIYFTLWHFKSSNSTPSMTLTLMVLRMIFQRSLQNLKPLYLTI